MKKKPTVGFPFFGAFSSDCLPKTKKDVSVHLFIHSSNFYKLYQRSPVHYTSEFLELYEVIIHSCLTKRSK